MKSLIDFPHFLLEREDKPERKGGGGVDVEMGGCHFFYYVAVQLHLLCVWEKVKFPSLLFIL